MSDRRHHERGALLIACFIILITLISIVAGFMSMTSTLLRGTAYDLAGTRSFWLSEAGLQRAIWNLKTPAGSGGQGENWTTAGTTQSLGSGNYTMVVARWDWALAANSATASANSSASSHGPENGNDGNDATYWESGNNPSIANPQYLTIHFPYALTLNKVRFLVPSGSSNNRPRNYSWMVSADNVSYSTVLSVTGNPNLDETDTFTAVSNVNYLRLSVTRVGSGSRHVRVATLEALGSKITSTGTVDVETRQIQETAAVDDSTQTAFEQIDWNQI